MCANHKLKKSYFTFIIYSLAILLGIGAGLSNILIIQDFAQSISDIFIKIFKCVSVPIIALSIIVTLSQYTAEGEMKKIWQQTLFYTISTTIIAASVAFILYIIIKPGNVTGVGITTKAADLHNNSSYFSYLSNIIPWYILDSSATIY
ncbi:MAG: hypothetical protein BGO27_07290 [Alphaproteobacteria bacterium 33-17]|nr:MAG: hypothetical protein BGO27_07290 [Alphaproteobacteria bacterium 33-17]